MNTIGHFFFRFPQTSKPYNLNTGPARGKRFLYLIEGEITRVLTAPVFRFNRLVALFQWSKYKNSIFDHFSATKMAPPGGDIKFVFDRSNSKFPTLSHAKNIFWISLSKKKLQNFSADLKKK